LTELPREQQLEFCFGLFDFDGDGQISIEDLYTLMNEINTFDLNISEDLQMLI